MSDKQNKKSGAFKAQSAITIARNKRIKAERHAKRMEKQAAKSHKVKKNTVVKDAPLKTDPKVQIVETSFRAAFVDSFKEKINLANGKLVAKVLDALDTKAGLIKRNEWNAHLSFKTATTLKAEGILV